MNQRTQQYAQEILGPYGQLKDFDLSKPQKLLKESARALLARECGPGRVRELM